MKREKVRKGGGRGKEDASEEIRNKKRKMRGRGGTKLQERE